MLRCSLALLPYLIDTVDLISLHASCAELFQFYADDGHVYLHFSVSDVIATVWVMSSIVGALEARMSFDVMLLNPSKAQFIWLGIRQVRQQLNRL